MLRRIAPFMAVAALAVIVPAVLAATPAHVLPTQRIDMKVLLVSADGTEPGFGAWKAELQREGVPYDTFVAYSGQNRVSTLTDEGLADYGANHAYYDAVILATGDLGHNVANANGTTSYLSALSDTEWASLAKFERTFGIRQLSDFTAPSPAHGLNVVGGATQDGNVGTLTPLGKAAFPYLKGPVPIANDDPAVAETFGYAGHAGQRAGLADPPRRAERHRLSRDLHASRRRARGDGHDRRQQREPEPGPAPAPRRCSTGSRAASSSATSATTSSSRSTTSSSATTPGTPTTHTTNYDPAAASRMTPADVAQAVAWSKARGVRIDFAFNGGGSELYKADHATTSDPLANAFADPATRGALRLHQPHLRPPEPGLLDVVLHRQGDRRQRRLGPPARPAARRHRGRHRRALRPGQHPARQPRHDRPAELRRRDARGRRDDPGGHLRLRRHRAVAGRRDDRLRRAPASPSRPRQTVTASFDAVCHAVAYNLYRSAAGANSWTQVARSPARPRPPPTTARHPIALTITDTGAARHLASRRRPPTAARALRPEPELPGRSQRRRHHGVATDASKAYPRTRPYRQQPAAGDRRRAFAEGADPDLPALPEQRLLQRLQAGPAARRVQLDLRRAGQRRGLRADRRGHHVPHHPGHVDRVRDEREQRHVPPRHGQRPAAALHAPEQPGRLQPGPARDRSQPGRHPLPGHRRPARALRRGDSTAQARRSSS